MLGRLVLLFLLTPAVELGLLIQVDRFIGFWPTIGLIVATGIAGSYLARKEGMATWRHLNERLGNGELPGKELADGVIILVAGALLITPGVLTDFIGFLGLIPPTRAVIRRVLLRRLRSKVEKGSVQVQFGLFGGAATGPASSQAPDSSSTDWNTNDSSAPDADSTDWKGRGHRMPRHSDDLPGIETNGDSSSSRDS